MQKLKGRFCFRTPTARDEGGALAIFQEMSSRPTTIVAMNISIAYGCISGHKTTVADAIKAYIQSDLNAKQPTYIELPKHLCPKRFRHYRRPVFRLVKALYGHPEAGGHWERHLRKIIRAMGGKEVPSHPSCFYFSETKMLLIVYVDDLMLSGPKEHHDAFWSALGKEVRVEPPEELERYLGRHHIFEAYEHIGDNVMEFFKSPIEA